MNPESEIKKWKKERRKYLPIVQTLLTYYNNRNMYKDAIEITDTEQILTIAKLIDIGYLDGKTVILDKLFETIRKVIYTKEFPLTTSGEEFYNREMGLIKIKLEKFKRIRFFLIIALIAFLITLLINIL